MRNRFARRAWILVVCLGAGLGAGIWAYRTWAPTSAAEVLAAVPHPTSGSPADQAVARWAERARLYPKDQDSWVNLGDALMQKARETMDTAYYGRADAVYRQALALNPKKVSAVIGLAWVTGARHEFEESVRWATQALALDINNHAAYGLLGDAAVEMGDYEAASRHYQKMLDIRPDLSSYSRGAHLLFLNGDTRKAAWLMQKAIGAGAPHAENTAWCRAQLALMLWRTGGLLPAEKILERALAQTPNNYHLLLAMGRVKASRREYRLAIDYYKKAAAIAPQHEALVALGDLYTLTGDRQEAERQYALVEQIHRLNQKNGVRGSIHMAQFYADHDRNLAEALKIAEQEYQARPNLFAADTLAWCYYKNGRYEEAEKTIRRALSHRAPDSNLLFHAGMIYARLGDVVRAQQYLYQALSLNPSFHVVHASVAADTLKQLGDGGPESAGSGG